MLVVAPAQTIDLPPLTVYSMSRMRLHSLNIIGVADYGGGLTMGTEIGKIEGSGALTTDALREMMANADAGLSDEQRQQILGHGRAAVLPLLALVAEGLVKSENQEVAETAVELLGDLRVPEVVSPLVEILRTTDADSWLYHRAIEAVSRLGPLALGPILDVYPISKEAMRHGLGAAAARLGVRDDRLFEILVKELEADPAAAAEWFPEYGDPRGCDQLSHRLDAFTVDEGDIDSASRAVNELVAAIVAMGGSLTAAQQQKFGQAMELAMKASPGPRAYLSSAI
jgi:hypothetical protein